MADQARRRRGIPAIPLGIDSQLRAVLVAMKERLEILSGERGTSGTFTEAQIEEMEAALAARAIANSVSDGGSA